MYTVNHSNIRHVILNELTWHLQRSQSQLHNSQYLKTIIPQYHAAKHWQIKGINEFEQHNSSTVISMTTQHLMEQLPVHAHEDVSDI